MSVNLDRWMRSAIVAALFVALAGCGGSDGGSASSGATTTTAAVTNSVGTTATTSSLPSSCTGVCNAKTPAPPTVSSTGGEGDVTQYGYGASSSGGACNYGATKVMYYAAINVNVNPGDGKGQWQGGAICGQCAQTTTLTSQGLKTVTVRIMDKCADPNCGIDIGGSAPDVVMKDGLGRYAGKWTFVSCKGVSGVSDASPTLFVKEGSNAYWSRIQVRNPATAVSSITYQSGTAAAQSLAFDSSIENYYIVPTTVLQSATSKYTITVKYVDGTTATAQLTPVQLGTASGSYALN